MSKMDLEAPHKIEFVMHPEGNECGMWNSFWLETCLCNQQPLSFPYLFYAWLELTAVPYFHDWSMEEL